MKKIPLEMTKERGKKNGYLMGRTKSMKERKWFENQILSGFNLAKSMILLAFILFLFF